MAIRTPAQGAEKLGRGISSGGENYRSGVMAVTESPMQKAADNADKWYAGVTRSFQDGSYVQGLLSVSLPDWKNKTANEGATRWQASAQRAQDNYLKFANQFYPHLATVQAEIQAMPSMNIDDNIQRMITNVRRNAEFSYQK